MKEEIIEYLEKKIQSCNELGGMELEKFAFIVTLKKVRKIAINYNQCSTQLKDKEVISFEEWKKRFVVKTETNNRYEFRGDFVLGEDLEFAYNKDVELYNSLIV